MPSLVARAAHADVFDLSSKTQVGWQLRRLWPRFGLKALGCLLLLLLLRPCVSDHGQCARACRVANGSGGQSVLGATGHWFDAAVGGRRLWADRSQCECFRTDGGGGALPHPRVERVHAPIETVDQWWFNTARVCGSDGKEYGSADEARHAGAHVANCGQCSKCSALQNVDAMHVYAPPPPRHAPRAKHPGDA